jgi:hypothetical protein
MFVAQSIDTSGDRYDSNYRDGDQARVGSESGNDRGRQSDRDDDPDKE